MDLKRLAPWNWFKHEEEESPSIPVRRTGAEGAAFGPLLQLHRGLDNLLRGSGLSPFSSELLTPLTAAGHLKPQVDISATEKEYCITVEVPGVSEKDVKVEITANVLTIRGEKKQEKEERGENYYRMERAYGSFQRVLTLPEDAQQEEVEAACKNGVLTIKMPRRALSKAGQAKAIEVKSAE